MNGKKLVCRHAGPPSSVRIGGITLTSCARQPILHAVGVAQQRDQQAADDERVGQRLVVLGQRAARA